MSEKRFEKSKSDITDYRIYDYEKEDAYFIDCDDESTIDAIVDLLNEQQSKITELEIELTDCKNRKEQSEYNLQKRIDEQEKIIKEQTLRTYCQDKEIQRLMGQLEKIPQSIREVWIDEQETE